MLFLPHNRRSKSWGCAWLPYRWLNMGRARACVFMAGGAAVAAAVADCDRVLIRGLVPVVLVLLRSRAMHRLHRWSCLADVIGALVGLEFESGVGTLVGIEVNALIALLMTLLIAHVIR
jgi:hypothetical protein